MRSIGKLLTGLVAVTAFVVASASAASTVPPTAQQNQHAWATLSMLTPVGATALAGSAAATEATADTSAPQADGNHGIPFPVIAVWLGVIALDVWILTQKNHRRAISPA